MPVRATIAAVVTVLATACGGDATTSSDAEPAVAAAAQPEEVAEATTEREPETEPGADAPEPEFEIDPAGPAIAGTVPAWLEEDGRFTVMIELLKATETTLARERASGFYTGWEIWQLDPEADRAYKTLWAPTDAGFEAAGIGIEQIATMSNEHRYLLLGHHFTTRFVWTSDVFSNKDVRVFGGSGPGDWRVALDADEMTWGGHPIIEVDHEINDWIVHVVDGLVVADEVAEALAS